MAEAKVIVSAENRTKQGLDDAKKDLANFEQDTGGIGKKILENFTVTFGDITNLVKGAFSTVDEFVNAYAESERALTSLKTALDISPKADLSDLEKLTKFASDLQALTGIGDDTTIALQSMLISTGRTADETMRIIKLAADYSAATGKSFQSSVEQINKTFGGSARQLGQLFPELKDLSEEELKSGDALEILEQKFGGFSEKLANTAATSVAKFNESWGDMKEALGEAIMPAVQPILENLVKFLNDPVIPTIQGFAPIVKEVFTAVEEIIIGLKPVVEPVLQWFADVWVKTIAPNIQALWEIVKNVFGLIAAIIKGDWSTAWNEAKKIVENVVGIIKNSLTPLTDFAKKIWDGVKGAWTSAWEGLKAAVKGPIDAIISFLAPVIEAVQKVIKGIEAANQFITGEKRVGNFLVDKHNKVIGEYIKNKDGTETLKRYAKGTQGAAPGLALVGEEGPELVIFHGGEQIIPNNLLPDNINIRGYANGTSGWVDTTVQSVTGKYLNVGATDNLSSVLEHTLSTLINSLGIFGNMIMGMNPLLVLIEPVLQGFVQIIGPAFTAVIQPVMNVLMQFGQLIAQALLPIFDALAPILAVVAQLMQNNLAPIISIVAGVAAVLAGVFDALTPVIVLVAKALTILTSPVEFLADLFNWVGGVINAFGANVGIALWNISHPFNQKGFVSGPGAFSSDAFSGLDERLAAIDALATNTGAISGSATISTTAAQSAQYRSQSITINIYQQSPVVGDNGMRQFAAMIRAEFEALAYYGT